MSDYPPKYPPNPRTHHTSSVEPNFVAKPEVLLTRGELFVLLVFLVAAVLIVGLWLKARFADV